MCQEVSQGKVWQEGGLLGFWSRTGQGPAWLEAALLECPAASPEVCLARDPQVSQVAHPQVAHRQA